MQKIISRCPVCNEEMHVTQLKCSHCETVIENNFQLSKFDYLTTEELHFTETFLKCRGNIKEVEKELEISYPTVRTKLNSIIKKLGFEDTVAQDEELQHRETVLKALERGELTVEEAIHKLK